MQLFALDDDGQLVSAEWTPRHRDCFCLECGAVVRVRAGVHRRKHFYHLQLSPSCRLNQKTMEHLQTQVHLQQTIGPDRCQLEKKFPEINRIADLVWPDQRMIFEIQCSAITSAEVLARNQDYAKIGYTVVWILHEKTFNRWRMTSAEMALRHRPCYFTNMDAEGKGVIYDQFDTTDKGVRRNKLDRLIIQPNHPLWHRQRPLRLQRTQQRMRSNSLHFSGDLTHVDVSGSHDTYISEASALEQQHLAQTNLSQATPWQRLFVRPYQILFRMLLESVSQ